MEGSVPLRAYQSHHEIYNKLLLSTKYPENSQKNCCFNQKTKNLPTTKTKCICGIIINRNWNDIQRHRLICCKSFFLCHLCLGIYKTKKDLMDHISTTTSMINNNNNNQQIYHCGYNECNKFYKNLCELNRHIRLIHNKRYQCHYKQCKINNKTFSTKWHLLRHEKTHYSHLYELENNNNKCKYCDKRFVDKYGLRKHIKLQHELCVKQYVCKKCKKRLKTKTALKEHIKTHLKRNERKLYECIQCNSSFTIKSNYNKHLRKYHS